MSSLYQYDDIQMAISGRLWKPVKLLLMHQCCPAFHVNACSASQCAIFMTVLWADLQ